MSRKNLVVLHLESVSVSLLQRFGEDFPTLRGVLDRAVRFEPFFTSAPSSIKSFCDFMYGNTSEMDQVVDWDDPQNRPAGLQRHLMDVLRDADYRVAGLGFPVIWRDDLNAWELFGRGRFDWHADRPAFLEALEAVLGADDERPFALYLWDLRSHLSYSDAEKPAEMAGFDRLRAGYRCTDQTLADVLAALERHGLLSSTVVCGYGDHGDQFWTHGLYFGFCHAFEPYTELIRTPAFVLDADLGPREVSRVTSVVDLKATCLARLGIPLAEPDRWDGGSDALASPRQVALCQSLFTNQQPNKALPKCWSVTDAAYHLVVSWFGLELFHHRMDPTNHNNLLSFFDLDGAGVLRFDDRGATHSHFRNTLNAAQVARIAEAFVRLRRQLADVVRRKIRERGPDWEHALDPRAFLRIRPREFTWNRNHLALDDRSAEVRGEVQRFLAGEPPYDAF